MMYEFDNYIKPLITGLFLEYVKRMNYKFLN